MSNTKKELIFNLALELANKRKDFSKKNKHFMDQWLKNVDHTCFNVLKLKQNSDDEKLFTDTIKNQLKIINNFKE